MFDANIMASFKTWLVKTSFFIEKYSFSIDLNKILLDFKFIFILLAKQNIIWRDVFLLAFINLSLPFLKNYIAKIYIKGC